MLQTPSPRLLGDIGHARTFASPVRRRVVQRATPAAVARGRDDTLLQPFINAGCALVADGCSAIATSGGYLALWQRESAGRAPGAGVDVELLRLAEDPGRRCGVIKIKSASLIRHRAPAGCRRGPGHTRERHLTGQRAAPQAASGSD